MNTTHLQATKRLLIFKSVEERLWSMGCPCVCVCVYVCEYVSMYVCGRIAKAEYPGSNV